MNSAHNISLTSFYRAIQEWIDNGCNEEENNPHGFIRDWGICSNLDAYILSMGHSSRGEVFHALNAELSVSLKECFSDHVYPFNTYACSYSDEENKYTNPKRLAWIKAQLAVV